MYKGEKEESKERNTHVPYRSYSVLRIVLSSTTVLCRAVPCSALLCSAVLYCAAVK